MDRITPVSLLFDDDFLCFSTNPHQEALQKHSSFWVIPATRSLHPFYCASLFLHRYPRVMSELEELRAKNRASDTAVSEYPSQQTDLWPLKKPRIYAQPLAG